LFFDNSDDNVDEPEEDDEEEKGTFSLSLARSLLDATN
jgi:hypothetical protein